MGWPLDWDARIAGTACRLCAEGRPEESRTGLRIYSSDLTDAYLARRALVRGYAVVIWRGRHVTEPHHLNIEDAALYHRDVLRVGRAIDDYFNPIKVNYMTLGNMIPHLHTHVTARHVDDPAPGAPLPAGRNLELPELQWRADAEALKLRLAT
jgi:diadenosine tetraphosphate (Ap4A) HIT family hydrolase